MANLVKFITVTLSTTPSVLSVNPKPIITTTALHCLRSDGHYSDAYMSQSQFNIKAESKESDNIIIWRHFREAQRNILYLNELRVTALEELKKANQEKQQLLSKIERLEMEAAETKHNNPKGRVDAMVLTGFINTEEASNFRWLIKDQRINVADVLSEFLEKNDAELLAGLRQSSGGNKKSNYHIVHICTEMTPLVSVGSVASYVTGLSRSLQKKGHLVEVILPKYANLNLEEVSGLREIETECYSYFNGQLYGNKIWTGVVYGIGVTFIQPVHYSSFFSREKVYGYPDDFERFSYFSRASLDYIVKSGKQPDVLHLHNWETAIVGPLFWDIFAKQGLENTRILLTCHGFGSQRLEEPNKLALCGLDPLRLNRPDRLQDNARTDLVNILKGGVVYSNKVVILSSMHSKDKIIQSLSHGLEPTLTIHKDKLVVSPSGLDCPTWDPSTDSFLPQNYNVDDMRGKTVCKVALQQRLGFSGNALTTLVTCIFSEGSDRELEKLKSVVMGVTRMDVQFIFMGISNVPSFKKPLEPFYEEFKGENVKFVDKDDEALSHLVFAGSDIVLCHSFHNATLEVPLKALKYGTAPITLVSNDSILRQYTDHDHETAYFSHFIYSTFGNLSLNEALEEININPSKWKVKITNAMAMDFSWDAECCDVHISAYSTIKNL
ncbi:hypothetical protein ACFE04_003485 [Oxalis oulophora]